MTYDYGTCHVCGDRMEERLADRSVHDGDDWLLVRAVPTGVCTRCGESILRWQVAERLEDIVRQRQMTKPEFHVQMMGYTFLMPLVP